MSQAIVRGNQSSGVLVGSNYKRPADEARAITIRNNILKRNQKIVNRFNELYNDKRLRYDDVIARLSEEFCIGSARVVKVLKNPAL